MQCAIMAVAGGTQLRGHCGGPLAPRLGHADPLPPRIQSSHRGPYYTVLQVCSPTRASFHTGRYPFNMGLYDNSAEAIPWLKVNDQAVPQNFTLLPTLLSRQGYATFAIGKW